METGRYVQKRGGGRYSQGSPSVEEESPDQTAFLSDLEEPGHGGQERRVLTGRGAPERRDRDFLRSRPHLGKGPPRLPERHQCL